MPPRILNCRVSIYIRKQSERESARARVWICEAINHNARDVNIVCFPDSIVQLVVAQGRPVFWFRVAHLVKSLRMSYITK
jgi:hypothetical protein